MKGIIGWVALVLCAPALLGQTAPAFEVASIKPHEGFSGYSGNAGASLEISGNRVTISGNLTGFVMTAYNLRNYQVIGGPDWIGKPGQISVYDIEAKGEGNAALTKEQARLMLQALLAERFQLKVHRDTKEMPVYNLEVAKGGLKIKESAPGTESKSDGSITPTITTLKYANVTMAGFVLRMAHNFDRPLLDNTGLKGGYDITMSYTPRRPELTGVEAEAAAARPAVAGPEIPITVALQDQLGLRAVPAKTQVEVVVIDHAEKPAAN